MTAERIRPRSVSGRGAMEAELGFIPQKVHQKPIAFGILFAYGFNLLSLHTRKIHFPEFSSDVSQEPFFSDAGRPVICILPGKNHTERY